MQIESKFKSGLVVVLLIMLATALVPFQVASWAHALQTAVRQSQERIEALSQLLSLMRDAETGQRGYIITGKENFLAPYHSAVAQMETVKAELRKSAAHSSSHQTLIDNICRVADLKLAELAETIELRRSKGFAAVEPVVTSARGKGYMDELRQIVGAQVAAERQQYASLQKELEWRSSLAAYISLGITLVNLIILMVLLGLMFKLLRGRTETSNALRKSSEELEVGMANVQRRNTEISLMSEMAQALESTLSIQETFGIVAIYCAKLLPDTAGTLHLFRNSRDLLELAATWGTPQAPQCIEPQDCWGLRRGQPHSAMSAADLCCAHYSHDKTEGRRHLCIPLMAQGEVLGLMCIEAAGTATDIIDSERALAITASEQIALALTNAKLREVLKQQSIVDPLTGLFNRRYMDETLKRELSRAARKSGALSFIVLDIDHFKRVNDTFGHDAGDAVLQAIAQQLKKDIRAGDLACRFGGEELVLILPECDKEAATARAENLRQRIGALDLQHDGQRIGTITASFGVAAYPADGETAESLFKATDQALYSAKNSGRNRVVVAG